MLRSWFQFVLCVNILRIGAQPDTSPSPPADKNITWKCQLCEDVLQTYHNRYRCAGEILESVPDQDGGPPTCAQSLFSCEDLSGELQSDCLKLEAELAALESMPADFLSLGKTPHLPKHLGYPASYAALHIREVDAAYKTCAKLKYCEEDSASNSLQPCHLTFNHPLCITDPMCKDFSTKCASNCYLCTWLVREWPRFQEYCKLPSVKTEKQAFLEEIDRTSLHHHVSKRSRAQERDQVTSLLDSGPDRDNPFATLVGDEDENQFSQLLQLPSRKLMSSATTHGAKSTASVLGHGIVNQACYGYWAWVT